MSNPAGTKQEGVLNMFLHELLERVLFENKSFVLRFRTKIKETLP